MQELQPTGVLIFAIKTWLADGMRHEWKDHPDKPLEITLIGGHPLRGVDLTSLHLICVAFSGLADLFRRDARTPRSLACSITTSKDTGSP
jgi:hypothetical protein